MLIKEPEDVANEASHLKGENLNALFVKALGKLFGPGVKNLRW